MFGRFFQRGLVGASLVCVRWKPAAQLMEAVGLAAVVAFNVKMLTQGLQMPLHAAAAERKACMVEMLFYDFGIGVGGLGNDAQDFNQNQGGV